MGKSLFEYASERQNKSYEEEKDAQVNSKNESQKYDEKTIKEQVNKYSKFSQEDLKKELFSKVGEQKEKGQFNFADLASRIEGIKPMLTSEQIKNLDNLLNQIK